MTSITGNNDAFSALGLTTQQTRNARSTSLGQADFLRLMTEQLKNQDPLKPLEGQQMLGREREPYFLQSLLLAMIFPSGLVLSNARATYEAFAGTPMDFARTPKAGAVIVGGWRGSPELAAGISLPIFALTEQAWSLPFFIIAAAGLLLIGAMGWQGTTRLPARDPGPGE